MSNYVITNETPGIVSLAPLRDLLGSVITLSKQVPSCEVDEETYQHEIMQRMLATKWVSAKPAGTAAADTPTPAIEPPAEPVAVAPPAEAAPAIEPPAEPVAVAPPPSEMLPETPAASSIPVEGPVSSETSISSGPKSSRKK